MAKRHRKRKSRTQVIRARMEKAQYFLARLIEVIRGGNPAGVGEWTLRASGRHVD